jgi:selenocysteine-specific elongation factor
MEIQPIVIGTAGHIDHGKSTLVQALTGIDPDRLKEEKERGLTIDLGFAPLELPDGRLVGIVDVPGHERFIRNMVAGATGIDLVVLVVAADDGVMPQTREHLQIMELLGVERGIVALTKVDMVEEEMADLAEEDIREHVVGTFLEEAPIRRVSAKTGQGLDEFRALLFELASSAEPRPVEGIFRMPVQRVFTKSGFGTVVTGIPVSGEARLGDVLEVLPRGKRGKIRGLNAYRQSTDHIRAGHSSAINFSDVAHDDVHRGDVVATPGFFSPQRMVAARLQTLADLDRSVTNRMPIRLHTGTVDAPGEVILLDREEIPPGEAGLVQLRLQHPVVCGAGDRFVLRLLSPIVTLGGGSILEESRHRLKRFREFVVEGLERQEASLSSPEALLESILVRSDDALASTEELAVALKRPRAETRAMLDALATENRLFSPRQDRWIHHDRLESACASVRAALEEWFAEHPHRALIDVRDLRNATRLEAAELSVLLEVLGSRDVLEQRAGGLIRLAGREPVLSKKEAELAATMTGRYEEGGFQPPSPEDLAGATGASAADVQRVLEHLVDTGAIERIGADLFMASRALDEAREAVRENCGRHGHLEIPDLRDRLGTSRKYLIPLLEYFDAQGLTIRQAGHRILRR